METTIPQIRVTVPYALRSLCAESPRNGELRIAASNVRDLLTELARRHPQVHGCICDEQGEPRTHINIFINDDHIRARGGLDTPLAVGDVVMILPAVSGG